MAENNKKLPSESKRGTARGRGPARFGGRKPFSTGDDSDPVVTVRNNRPVVRGFANAGAVFGDKKDYGKEELHPQVVKMARKSGMLNLSNKAMDEVPDKVFHLYDIDSSEAKQMTLNMSMDNSSEDNWWESVDLSKLYLNSNCIATIPADIRILSSLQILDLSDNRLTTLPAELSELKQLQRLSVSHNKLTEIPDEAFNLPELRFLKLDHNNMKKVPDMVELTLLDQLDLSHNELEALPDSICYLNRLTKLTASHNKITELSSDIGDLFALQELDLNYNAITSLPSALQQLVKLSNLYLCHNRLTVLPTETNMPALRELHLANNCIKELNGDQLSGLKSLRVLDLRDNKLDDLPDDITLLQMLERLDLANNTLSNVPCHLGLLSHLKSMPLEGNPLRLLRRDIVQRGTQQLLRHLREKLPNPPSSYPGFSDSSAHPEGGSMVDQEPQSHIPDKWQLKSSKQVVYSEKASSIPEELLDNAMEAKVPNVDFSGNILTALPDKLAGMSDHVKELVISINRLTCLPSYLGSFTHLVYIDVHANRLETLPEELGQLKYLRELNMTHNRITSLPECLRNNGSLEIVFAGDNRITEVDVTLVASWPRIATLHINNNNIGFLPPPLGNVTQIRSLLIEGNPFRVPRAAIIAKGTNEVMSYLRSRVVPE